VPADPVDRPHRNRARGRGIFAAASGQADRGPGEGVTSASVLTQVPCSLGHYREFLLIGLSGELSALIRQSSLSRHFVVKREVAAQ